MPQRSPPLFGKTKFITRQIDEFLDKISEGGMLFQIGLTAYIEHNIPGEKCEEKLKQLKELKGRSNELRRAIGRELYTEMLIPDARGDVLSLLQDLFYLVDLFEKTYQELLIEQPKILPEIKEDFKELTAMVVQAVETAVSTARAYFRTPLIVGDYVHKISFYETESDNLALGLKKKIFNSDLLLEQKLQLRNAVDVIDQLADKAEDLGDWLAIYTIKRAL